VLTLLALSLPGRLLLLVIGGKLNPKLDGSLL
jgi:hypothetical protein